MNTKELLAFDAGTQLMHILTTEIFIRVKDYPNDPKLKGLYFNTEKGTFLHASHLENEVMRYQ